MSVEEEQSHGEILCPGCSANYELKSVTVPNDDTQTLVVAAANQRSSLFQGRSPIGSPEGRRARGARPWCHSLRVEVQAQGTGSWWKIRAWK